MAYEKQNFKDGQILTANCLNCIEDCLAEVEAAVSAARSEIDGLETELATALETGLASAMETARAANTAAGNAQSSANTALDEIVKIRNDMSDISINPDDLGLEQDSASGLVYPTYRGVRSENGIPIISASADGALAYTITLRNTLDSRVLTVADGAAAELKFTYTSVDEDGYDDGAGVGTILVDEVRVATVAVPQGSNTLDVAQYLTSGEHSVKIKVSNSEGTVRTIPYTVTLVSLKMTTTLSALSTYSGDVTFYYTPIGSGTKTIHFIMDGVELGTASVVSSNKSSSYVIPTQAHGGHVFEAYAESIIGGVPVKSNTITLGMLWIESGNQTAGIVSPFSVSKAMQGETLTIDYLAYNPASESAVVSLLVINPDNTVYSSKELTVGRTAQTWTVDDYPVGNVTFRLSVSGVHVDKIVEVADSGVAIERITDSLVFDFDANGRSNQEETPGVWTNGAVSATFTDVTFSGSDGWLTDAEGASMLRLLPGSEVTIPFSMFATDHRTNGATVEVEMSTNNVRDYDSVVMSCLSGGRGFKIASQYAQLNSEQTEISMQFREERRVRVSFVVGPKNLMRMIYVFVDGIMCGALQYPDNDDFSQSPAVGITIGAESSGIDIYRIAMYNKGLTRQEVLTNYIADRATLKQRIDAHKRNDVLDVSDDIVIPKLPATLPYMIISSVELPQSKGNPKPCSITYVDPADGDYSFTATGASVDVQGTSSAGYKKKNFLITLSDGITYTKDGKTADTYALSSKSLPVNVFCLKADVASSDNANNVELVRLYNDVCPYRHPAMVADPRIRYGIEGHPIVVFWQNTATGETKFWGKYNFNNDKSTPEPFGWSAGYECWEIKNNGNDRVNFKKSDFSDSSWKDDFEAVYPKKSTDTTQLKRLTDWLVSTDRGAVSSESEKAARLEKFRTEFENYFVKDAMLFYYLFTETFLMVDNRAKNFFPTYDPKIQRWYPFPYDMDTALGINNEGQLVFDYDLEDTDQVGGYDVYNAQGSVLWCNVRDAFTSELEEMYAELRNTNDESGVTPFSYESVFQRFDEHQSAWPEAVWNEDAYEKYLAPLFDDNDPSYLTMLQGPKASQRDWWSYNGFRYRDSKYQAGDASKNYITLRCYALGDITVTPYSHIWPRIKYASATVAERGKRNIPTTLVNPNDKVTDGETYIYSADRLADIGDLAPLQIGYADFTAARKLQRLKLGDGTVGYQNTKLTELYVGNNDLLTELDVQNCIGLTAPVDLSGCDGLEIVKARGSSTTGLNFAVGGRLKTLELPGTIANFTIRDNKLLESVTFEGYSAMTTLRVENTPNVPIEAILTSAGNLNRVRLVGVDWTAESETTLSAAIAKLKSCKGMDADSNNTDNAVVTGKVRVSSISAELLMDIYNTFPELAVVANGVTMYLVRFLNDDGTLLHSAVVNEGSNADDPVVSGAISTPKKDSTPQYTYTYIGWDGSLTNIRSSKAVRAKYAAVIRTYTVKFYNGSTLLQTATVPYGGSATYTGSTPVDATNGYPFEGWSPQPTNIKADTNCYAQFESPVQVAEIADSWEQIMAAVADGTARTKYKIGNYKPMDLGAEGIINMQIVAFDADDLADGSGKAPITWISKELLATSRRMNPPLVKNADGTYEEGTGCVGGWEKCEMRSYLRNTIMALLPESVKNSIVTVKRTSSTYDATKAQISQTTNDTVWIPRRTDVSSSGSNKIFFSSDEARKKCKVGTSTFANWWTINSAITYGLPESFYMVAPNGTHGVITKNASEEHNIALGFCT